MAFEVGSVFLFPQLLLNLGGKSKFSGDHVIRRNIGGASKPVNLIVNNLHLDAAILFDFRLSFDELK
jgi:hypothetical protein